MLRTKTTTPRASNQPALMTTTATGREADPAKAGSPVPREAGKTQARQLRPGLVGLSPSSAHLNVQTPTPATDYSSDRKLTTTEAAKFLGVAAASLEDWRVQRRGPAYVKYGNRLVFYRLSDLQAFEDQHVVRHAAQEEK